MYRQFTGYIEVVAYFLGGGALEGHGRKLGAVEEVMRLEVLDAGVDAGIDAIDIDVCFDGGLGDVGSVELDDAGNAMETPVNGGDGHVLNGEVGF